MPAPFLRDTRLVVWIFILCAAGALALYAGKGEAPAFPSVAGASIGGPFSLVDHNGRAVSEKDFPGWKLIYFGFTYCPAICPTELQKMAVVMKRLDPATAEKITPIFVSVDPGRDTPEVLKGYVPMFHPRLVGLTGSAEQVEAVKRAWRVYAAKVEDPGASDYTVDHSSFTYLMAPDGSLAALYKIQDKAEAMAEDIAARLAAAQGG